MRVGRVRRVFKWAASQELVPANVYAALSTVVGLQRGRTNAREKEPVGVVAEEVVTATLPNLPRHVAGLVRFQLATGCRPGEACTIRRADLDTSGPVWFYRPPHHKLSHRGLPRTIAVGPKAQAVLAEFPSDDPDAFVFSPAKCEAERAAERSNGRLTPQWSSHLERNRAKRKRSRLRPPGEFYTNLSYGRAIARGVEKANTRRARLAGTGNFDPLPHWHPNQLRHAHATVVRKLFGLEAAQVALGHTRANVTQVYAERNQDLAAKVAAAVG
jgi:integrase